jgi:hypothetical protein
LTPLILPLVPCLLIVTICYIGLCSASPSGTCTRCRSANHKRTCRACDGTGMRPRLGWQVYTALRRIYKDGTR